MGNRKDLYKDISKSELENYSIKSNATILGDNKNEIDVEKIKKSRKFEAGMHRSWRQKQY